MNYEVGQKLILKAKRNYPILITNGSIYHGEIVKNHNFNSNSVRVTGENNNYFRVSLSSCTNGSWFDIIKMDFNENIKII